MTLGALMTCGLVSVYGSYHILSINYWRMEWIRIPRVVGCRLGSLELILTQIILINAGMYLCSIAVQRELRMGSTLNKGNVWTQLPFPRL